MNFAVTHSFQDGIVNLDKMTPSQRNAYIDAHVSIQQHIAQANHYNHQHHQHQNSRQTIKDIEHQNHPQTSQAYSVSSSIQHFPSLKIPQVTSNVSNTATSSSLFTTVGDDGLVYDNGIRVLQSFGNLGNWEIPSSIPKPNLIPFTEPYVNILRLNSSRFSNRVTFNLQVEGGSLNPNTKLHHHTLKHHPTSTSTTRKSRNNHSSGAPKAFECTVCGKGLARKDKLTIHTRIHTG